MIYQHITGRRPISLDAAIAYATGFKCPLEEISFRLATEAKKAALVVDLPQSTQKVSSLFWPFPTPYELYEAIPIEKKKQLGELVKAFIEGALPIHHHHHAHSKKVANGH